MDNFTIYEDFIPASVGGGYGTKYDDGVRDDGLDGLGVGDDVHVSGIFDASTSLPI